jgi:hypothetical protein
MSLKIKSDILLPRTFKYKKVMSLSSNRMKRKEKWLHKKFSRTTKGKKDKTGL